MLSQDGSENSCCYSILYGVILHMFSGPVTDANKIDIMHGTDFLVPVLDSVTTVSGDTSESY